MFRLFGTWHWAGIVSTFLWAYGLHWFTGFHQKTQKWFARISGIVILSFYPLFVVYTLTQGDFNPQYHLPLQVSNFILIWVGLSLLFKSRIWYALSIFWALPGGLASITFPDIDYTFPHPHYLMFWISHAILLGFVVFLFQYRHYDISPKLVMASYGLFVLYVGVIYPFNELIGSNYGYLNHLPPSVDLPSYLQESWQYIPFVLALFALISATVFFGHRYLMSFTRHAHM